MKTFTIHMPREKADFVEHCVQSGLYIDASDVFEKSLETLYEQHHKSLLARKIFIQKIMLSIKQLKSNDFSHRDVTSIIEGHNLCPIDQTESLPYRMTGQADIEIEDAYKFQITQYDTTIAKDNILKIESHMKGISKLESHKPLSKIFPTIELFDTSNLYFSKTKNYYTVFTLNENNVDILTLHFTSVDFSRLAHTIDKFENVQ